MSKNNKKDIVPSIIFATLNLLLVPFSVYQTYLGYIDVADELGAIVIAAATGILFFALNYEIMKRRKEGKRHLLLLFGFLIPLTFSFFGNFHAFYNRYMEIELMQGQFRDFREVLDQTYLSANEALIESAGIEELKGKVNKEKTILKAQITDPNNGGYGDDSKVVFARIEQLLGTLTQTANGKTHLETYQTKARVIDDALNVILGQRSAQISPTIQHNDTLYNKCSDRLQAIINDEKLVDSLGTSILDEVISSNNRIGSKTSSYMEKAASDTSYKYTKLASENYNIHKISYSIKSGFVDHPNLTASVFLSLISLIIDLGVLIYIFTLSSFVRKKTTNRVGVVEEGPTNY